MIQPSAHHRWLALLLGLLFATHLGAQQEQKHLVSLSLEELMELRIALPAALTRLTLAETPASITVITAEDIRHTPARNIYDLLEVFVPGAIWMNREGGPLPGIRGSTVERNYKYLLRVNGRVMNSKAYFGAGSELELWDLNDVQRIEVVRGPGSVTYGPGAVAGVINIVTHDATSNVDDRVAVRGVGRYNSRGLTANHTWRSEGLDLFAYANITRTTGAKARQFLVDDNDVIGFIGEDILTDTEPMEYFADYQGDPQIKLHLDGRFSDLWRVWARYTQQGSTWRGNEVKTDFNGLLVNQEGVRNRQWIANLEHSPRWGDYELTSTVGLSSFDGERRVGKVRHPDPDHTLNKRVDYSESELFLSTRLNWRASDLLEVAVGSEYSWDFYGPGWGDDASIMRHGDGGIIVNGPDSRAIDPTSRGSANRRGTAIFVGDGWSTHTFAAFSEVNVVVSPRVRALLSARADRTTHFDWMVSPRAAVIVGVGEGRFIKFTAQQSRRFNTAAQVLIAVENGFAPDDESLTGLELAYAAYAVTGFNVDMVIFWNKGEVIANDGDANVTKSVGDLELYGVEAAIDYRWGTGRVGANYSRLGLRDWRLTPGVPRSGISYSDYNQPLKNSDAVQVGTGNDLNNWPNQAFKLFGRLRVADQFTLHADSRFFWDYQGAKDGLVGLQNAVRGQAEEASVASALAALEPYNVYSFDFRLNASLTYEVGEGLSVQVSARNLLGANGNKRYAHDTGNDRPSPRRIRFVEEPRVFGATLAYAF